MTIMEAPGTIPVDPIIRRIVMVDLSLIGLPSQTGTSIVLLTNAVTGTEIHDTATGITNLQQTIVNRDDPTGTQEPIAIETITAAEVAVAVTVDLPTSRCMLLHFV